MAKYALCIGINDYPGTSSDLNGCVNDAHNWAATFKSRGFNVQTLLNRLVTGAAMSTAIQATLAKAERGDSVAIEYTGNGSVVDDLDGEEPDGTHECLCPWDVTNKGVITDDELFQLFSARAKGVRLVMLSDFCQLRRCTLRTDQHPRHRSGPRRTAALGPLPSASSVPQGQVPAQPRCQTARRASSPPGRHAALLMSGCQDSECSYDAWFNGRANGAFTFVGLRELANLKAKATYRDWYTAIRHALPSKQYSQTANLQGTSAAQWAVALG